LKTSERIIAQRAADLDTILEDDGSALGNSDERASGEEDFAAEFDPPETGLSTPEDGGAPAQAVAKGAKGNGGRKIHRAAIVSCSFSFRFSLRPGPWAGGARGRIWRAARQVSSAEACA
jgi:hypothetical protein